MRDVFDGMLTRNGGFHDFDRRRGEIVFRAQSDDRAAGVKHIPD